MSERDGFQHGVPCWVDTWQDDIDATVAFYTGLFGWEAQVGERVHPVQPSRPRRRGRRHAAARRRAAGVDDVRVGRRRGRDRRARGAQAATLVREPFDSLDGGRMAIVADPAGAVLGVWQLGEHRGARVVNEPGAWAMSALSTPDPEGAKAFYGAVFGWETLAFGDRDDVRLPGFVGGEPEQPVPRDVVAVMVGGERAAWGVDFWVDDVDAAAERAATSAAVLSAPADSRSDATPWWRTRRRGGQPEPGGSAG